MKSHAQHEKKFFITSGSDVVPNNKYMFGPRGLTFNIWVSYGKLADICIFFFLFKPTDICRVMPVLIQLNTILYTGYLKPV